MRVLIALLTLLLFTLDGAAQDNGQSRSLLDALYRLVWPAGRFEGDLPTVVSRSTQKGTSAQDSTALFVVNARTGVVTEWPSTERAADPVFCPSDNTLYYRRGDKIVAEILDVAGPNNKATSHDKAYLKAPATKNLVACTTIGGRAVLWIQVTDDNFLRMVRQGTSLVPAPPNSDGVRADIAPSVLAEQLRVLRALRPDGLSVAVLNGTLVAERPGKDRFLLVDADSIEFSGIPTWLQGTDLLFVSGAKGVPQ
jgi:hypothetical protein